MTDDYRVWPFETLPAHPDTVIRAAMRQAAAHAVDAADLAELLRLLGLDEARA